VAGRLGLASAVAAAATAAAVSQGYNLTNVKVKEDEVNKVIKIICTQIYGKKFKEKYNLYFIRRVKFVY